MPIEKYLKDYEHNREKNMHANLFLDIICSSKLTVFLELCPWKTVEQVKSVDKYPCICLQQIEAIVY